MPQQLETLIKEPQQKASAAIIWLHGLGADGHDFAGIETQLQLPSNHPVRFIYPHAPIRPVTINANLPARAWYDIRSIQDLNWEDQPGILQSEYQIRALIEQQKADNIASNRIFLAGFSQGGAMALFTAIRYQEPLAGVLALSAYLPLLKRFPHNEKHQSPTLPILQTHGSYDDIVPVQLGKMSRDYLAQLGYPIHWQEYPMRHELCLQEINDISQWLTAIFLEWTRSLEGALKP